MDQTCQHVQLAFHFDHRRDVFNYVRCSLERDTLVRAVGREELAIFVAIKDPVISFTFADVLLFCWYLSIFVDLNPVLIDQHLHMILNLLILPGLFFEDLRKRLRQMLPILCLLLLSEQLVEL